MVVILLTWLALIILNIDYCFSYLEWSSLSFRLEIAAKRSVCFCKILKSLSGSYRFWCASVSGLTSGLFKVQETHKSGTGLEYCRHWREWHVNLSRPAGLQILPLTFYRWQICLSWNFWKWHFNEIENWKSKILRKTKKQRYFD